MSEASESQKMSPAMRALVVAAVAVALLALIIMFVFVSHQVSTQSAAQNQTTTQSSTNSSQTDDTQGTIGPIEVDESTLYNRENKALGKSGSGPQSVITDTQVDIPGGSYPGSSGQ